MSDWTDFGLRHLPTMSAVEPSSSPPDMAPVIEGLMAEVQQSLTVPVRGVTSDGAVIPGLSTSTAGGTSTGAIREAAATFLGSLNAIDAQGAQFAVDAEQWRTWFNIHPYVLRHGVLLANLAAEQRRLALEVVRATLSARGLEQSRNIMRINGLLATITSSPTEYDEWYYFISTFGTPSADEPWGWQLDGSSPEHQLLPTGRRHGPPPDLHGL